MLIVYGCRNNKFVSKTEGRNGVVTMLVIICIIHQLWHLLHLNCFLLFIKFACYLCSYCHILLHFIMQLTSKKCSSAVSKNVVPLTRQTTVQDAMLFTTSCLFWTCSSFLLLLLDPFGDPTPSSTQRRSNTFLMALIDQGESYHHSSIHRKHDDRSARK